MANHETTLEQSETASSPEASTDAASTDATASKDVAEQDTQEIALSLWDQVYGFAEGLMRPWNAYQVLIAIAIILVSISLSRLLGPRLHHWMRSRQGWPKWRFRLMLLIQRRLSLIFFVALVWITVLVMREVTWPSRSYLLGVFANLATAWLIIALLTRLVHNSFLRSLLRYGAWAWVTLVLIGLNEEFRQLMDSAAINFGTLRLSLWTIIQGAVMLGLTFAIARFVSGSTATSIRKNKDISPSMQVLVIKFMQVLLYGAAFFTGLKIVGVDLTGLAVLSGAIGVGLGFGLQKVVSNLVSGIIILLDKSIKPGDVISLGETFGWINSLGARYVSVVTRDGREYLIPNEDLITGQVVNWSHSNDFVRLDIYFGTAYGDDPHQVREVAIKAAMSVDRVLQNPKTPVCHIVGFGDSSVDYILRFWIKDPTGGLTNIRGNVYLALWDAFKDSGVNFPFPQREVRILGDDPKVLD